MRTDRIIFFFLKKKTEYDIWGGLDFRLVLSRSKTARGVRGEGGVTRRYCHIGTGNYNPKTARLYEDLGILTADPRVGADLTDLFNTLTGYSRQTTYRSLLVAPHGVRDRKSTRLNSSHANISYAVFCLKK